MKLRHSNILPNDMKQSGFTLIELMITVALVAILTAVAIPSYRSAGAKSDRSIAIADINEISQALERYFTYNRTYTNDFGNLNMGSDGDTEITDNQGVAKYDYTIGVPSDTEVDDVPLGAGAAGLSYVIYAKPAANGSRDPWMLSQDHMGTKKRFKDNDPGTEEIGWP